MEKWDELLNTFYLIKKNSDNNSYDDMNNNCFDFVTQFLNFVLENFFNIKKESFNFKKEFIMNSFFQDKIMMNELMIGWYRRLQQVKKKKFIVI